MEKFIMTTLERILTLIKSKYESDAAFEREAGLTTRVVSSWKCGKSKTFMDILPRLAALLGTTSAYLLCETDDPAPPGAKKEPATVSDDEFYGEIGTIWDRLSPENRPKLLELARLYLDAQDKSGEK